MSRHQGHRDTSLALTSLPGDVPAVSPGSIPSSDAVELRRHMLSPQHPLPTGTTWRACPCPAGAGVGILSSPCHPFGRQLWGTQSSAEPGITGVDVVLTVSVCPNGICLKAECISPFRLACVAEESRQSCHSPSPASVSYKISSLYHTWKDHQWRRCSA